MHTCTNLSIYTVHLEIWHDCKSDDTHTDQDCPLTCVATGPAACQGGLTDIHIPGFGPEAQHYRNRMIWLGRHCGLSRAFLSVTLGGWRDGVLTQWGWAAEADMGTCGHLSNSPALLVTPLTRQAPIVILTLRSNNASDGMEMSISQGSDVERYSSTAVLVLNVCQGR